MKSIKKNKYLIASLLALCFGVVFLGLKLEWSAAAQARLFEHQRINNTEDLREHFRRCAQDCRGVEREFAAIMVERLADVDDLESASLTFHELLKENFNSLYRGYLASGNPEATANFLSSAYRHAYSFPKASASRKQSSLDINWNEYFEDAAEAYQNDTAILREFARYKALTKASDQEITAIYKRCLEVDYGDDVCRRGYNEYVTKLTTPRCQREQISEDLSLYLTSEEVTPEYEQVFETPQQRLYRPNMPLLTRTGIEELIIKNPAQEQLFLQFHLSEDGANKLSKAIRLKTDSNLSLFAGNLHLSSSRMSEGLQKRVIKFTLDNFNNIEQVFELVCQSKYFPTLPEYLKL